MNLEIPQRNSDHTLFRLVGDANNNLKIIDLSVQENIPSDYFGENFELDTQARERLQKFAGLSANKFEELNKNFSNAFDKQKGIEHNKTNLNFYFCDYVLHERHRGAIMADYFSFEFYKKSFDERKNFVLRPYLWTWSVVANEIYTHAIADNKARADKLFGDLIHKDWLDTVNCDFSDFKNFVEKHRKFFAKPIFGVQGFGGKIIQIDKDSDLEKLFADLKSKKILLEELIVQHDSVAEFYSGSVNTIRLDTILDVHNVVNVVSACGRFGRAGMSVDNYSSGGFAVSIDPKIGVIISDAVDHFNERVERHPDTGKKFKGFQYPCWEKVLKTVRQMAKRIPDMRYIGWDFTVTNNGDVVLIEMNCIPGENIQQAPDSVGKRQRYETLIEEIKNYKQAELKSLGWRVNKIDNFNKKYEQQPSRQDDRLKLAFDNLVEGCESVIDLGCRQNKPAKKFCPSGVKYYPVDYKKFDDEIVVCDFNLEEFPNLKANTVLCAFTAEYVAQLKKFLENMTQAAQKQILMICRPADKEIHATYRWEHPFLTDFTEKFLVETLEQNHFKLHMAKPMANVSVILYDFRKC